MAPDTPSADARPTDRHATWMELFFDLVAVAGIGQLTHLLHRGPSLADFGLYLLLYLAFWTAWACMMLYGNIARDQTRIPLMLATMLGLGLMAGAVAGIPDRHATTFAAVYVLVRAVAAQVWGRGTLVVDWPIAQLSIGVLPWIVSLWVPEPWKYWLWALGLALDLWLMFGMTGERMMAGAQDAIDRRFRTSRRFKDIEPPKIRAVHADSPHLGERLGLYVIIVLGEGVIAVIGAVGGVPWNARVLALGFGAFVVLAVLWALTLMYGFIPRLMAGEDPEGSIPRQYVMAMHCWITGAIATIAAGLGLAVEHAKGHVSTGIGWSLCGGAAAYFVITGLGGMRSGAGWRWILTWPLPCAVLAVLLGAFGPHIGALGLVYGVVAIFLVALLFQTYASGKWRTGSGPDRPRRKPWRRPDHGLGIDEVL
ncbi:low temperature requirement protein A [Nocardia iowensis]|uniref:Low temperature requirement protein A n=1 Tax=Nocardia iowensis TaxID=204891 RepID=A0ABX8RL83_NOCIO|nr:low temperature requirement protein A [Nocardia iowensis]QXN90328.1 low temperature requirement protein A [Nocardia iowensis]